MLKKLTFDKDALYKKSIKENLGLAFSYSSEGGLSKLCIHPDHKHKRWEDYKFSDNYVLEEMLEIEHGIYKGERAFNLSIDYWSLQNARNDIYMIKNDGTFISYYDLNPKLKLDYENAIDSYGVADNVEQVKEHFKVLFDTDLEFCISVCPVKRKEQPQRGGWRWDRYGKYIGTQKPQSECLYDEPKIKEVLMFRLHVLVDK